MRAKHRVLLALFLTISFGLAACGGGNSDEQQSSSGSSDVSNLQDTIDAAKEVPEFKAPGPPIDPNRVEGSTVLNIPDSSSNPFATGVAEAEAEAAKALGIEYVNCTNQGGVTEWATCFDQATQRKVDIINDFGGVDPSQVRPQIEKAQNAGIEVVGQNVYGYTQQPEAPLKYSVPTPYEDAADLMATWAILDTKRNTNALVITSKEVLATAPMVDQIKKTFAKECSGCKLTFINVPVKDWSTKIQSNVQSALVRDPEINYVLPIYDSMTQFVVPAIRGAGKTGSVFVSTFNGTPFVLKYLQENDIVKMDVGVSQQWIGYAFMDADARLIAGMELDPVFDAKIPLRVFTKDNVAEAGNPPNSVDGYGDSFVSDYKKLWKVG